MTSQAGESSLDALKRLAGGAELSLTAEEADKLLPGVRRNRQYAEALRSLLTPGVEPAFRFEAGEGQGG